LFDRQDKMPGLSRLSWPVQVGASNLRLPPRQAAASITRKSWSALLSTTAGHVSGRATYVVASTVLETVEMQDMELFERLTKK